MNTQSSINEVPEAPYRYRTQLARQLGFIRRSAQLYDEGHPDEAIRIAVAIRVLVHGTGSSPSLLRLLGADKITLTSTCAQTRLGAQLVRFMGLGVLVNPGSANRAYKPFLSRFPAGTLRALPVQEWWEQTVYVIDSIPLSRENIVLSAANKDGGLQVDPKFDPRYERISQPRAARTADMITSGKLDSLSEEGIPDAHLVALRQMAFEVLNSPELLVFSVSD